MRPLPSRSAATLALAGALSAQAQPPTVEIHATGTLATRVRPEQEPTLVVPGTAQSGPALDAGALEAVTEFASAFVRPRQRPGEEMRSLGKTTIVGLLRPAQHAWLRRFIAINQSIQNYVLRIDARFVQLTPQAHQKLIAPLFARQQPRRDYVVLAVGAKTDAYMKALLAHEGVDTLTNPSLVCLPASRANVSVLSQTTYVKDFQPEFDAQNRLQKVEPVIGIVQDGVVLDVRGALVRKGVLGLRLHAIHSDLERPLRKVPLRFDGIAEPFEMQIPKVHVLEVKSDVEIPNGATVMFALPRQKDRHLAVFVTARRMAAN